MVTCENTTSATGLIECFETPLREFIDGDETEFCKAVITAALNSTKDRSMEEQDIHKVTSWAQGIRNSAHVLLCILSGDLEVRVDEGEVTFRAKENNA